MSHLPQRTSGMPKKWNEHPDMIGKTLAQVEKDFALQGLQLSLKTDARAYPEIVHLLAQKMESLDLVHNAKLAAVLYQIDLSEKELRHELPETAADRLYFVLADKVIRRCFQKVWTREFFGKG